MAVFIFPTVAPAAVERIQENAMIFALGKCNVRALRQSLLLEHPAGLSRTTIDTHAGVGSAQARPGWPRNTAACSGRRPVRCGLASGDGADHSPGARRIFPPADRPGC